MAIQTDTLFGSSLLDVEKAVSVEVEESIMPIREEFRFLELD